jgi:predicted enzyme related to lactoylglutathione lyase
MKSTRPVVHFEIASRDAARQQRFYADLFGWTINADNPMRYGLVDTGGSGGIGGAIAPAGEDGTTGVRIYVQVDDLARHLELAEKLGGRTLTPPTAIPGVGDYAVFSDPEGIRIGLLTRRS